MEIIQEFIKGKTAGLVEMFKSTLLKPRGKPSGIKAQVSEAIQAIENLYERRGRISGIPTGFTWFDDINDGMHGGELIVIAGDPDSGKTMMAVNIARHVAVNNHQALAVFSLEKSVKHLTQQLICTQAGMSLKKINDGFLSERDFPKLCEAANQVANSKMIIDDTAGLSIREFCIKARQLKSKHDIKLIILDGFQLLRSILRNTEGNRFFEHAEMAEKINAFAKELDVPIIVTVQTNPENPSEGYQGNLPPSDLGLPGDIHLYADLVGVLVRPKESLDPEIESSDLENKVTLFITKHRNGRTDKVNLNFLHQRGRFEEIRERMDDEVGRYQEAYPVEPVVWKNEVKAED